MTGKEASRELAFAALSHFRKSLKSRSAARIARALGVGAATGIGSIVYTLTVMSALLREPELLVEAHAAAELLTDDLIDADEQLDAMSGSAGAILGLLRLYRQAGARETLDLATRCGWHLLRRPRSGAEGQQSWAVPGYNSHALNGVARRRGICLCARRAGIGDGAGGVRNGRGRVHPL